MSFSNEFILTDELMNVNKIRIPQIKEPVGVRIYWFQFHNYSLDPTSLYFKEHMHTFHEAHFIMRGSMLYEADGQILHTSAGQFLLLPANSKHRQLSCTDDFIKFSLSFEILSTLEHPFSQIMHEYFSHTIAFQDQISEDILASLHSIRTQIKKNRPIAPVIVSHDLFSIICSLYYACCDRANAPIADPLENEDIDSRYLLAKKFIKDNVFVNLKTKDVANYVNLSIKQLNRIFIEHKGMSVFNYISEQKCHWAKDLITSTELSLREISAKLGFNDEFYFNKYFTKKMGITPLKFRKINGKLYQNKEKEDS